MKYITLGMVLCAMMTLFCVKSAAQTTIRIDIEAIVRGSDGEPVSGAVVKSEYGTIRAITDINGRFNMQTMEDAEITIEALGYEDGSVTATERLKEVVLIPEKVQIAFRKVNKKDLLGGVSQVSVSDMINKNYSTYSMEAMDTYVGGYNGTLWGMGDYLVLVDGVPRDANNVLPTEIDNITFLKGASAVALYGSRAANGVVYISTKRGGIAEKSISVRANTAFVTPIRYPKYLGSAEYMTFYNEARENDGLEPLYSDETIYNYASGNNPYRYPDLDFYSSEYLRKASNRTDATAEISGGNERARFYTNIGFTYANSLLNFGEAKDDNVNRLNVRGNIDLKLNDFITSWIDANATYYNSRRAHGNFWYGASTLRPNRLVPLIPISLIEEDDAPSLNILNTSSNIIKGKYLLGGTQLDQTNFIADAYAAGYNKYVSRQFQFNAGVNMDLANVLEGLSFTTQFSVDYATTYNQAYNNSYAVYEPVWVDFNGREELGSLKQYGKDAKDGNQNIRDSWYRQTIYFSGQFDYNRVFNDHHNVSAMLIASGWQQSLSQVYHRTSNVNLGLQLGYNYRQKYYADFSGAVVHSAKLAPGNRAAFSPTVSLGWRISKEPFLAGSSVVDDLKLSASAGILNTDLTINDYYLYQGVYTQIDGAWHGWKDGAVARSTDSRRAENKNLGFSKRKEFSINLEASLFKKAIMIDASFFANRMTDLVSQISTEYPSYFTTYWPESSFVPYVNFNSDQRIGFDFSVLFNKRIGKVDGTLGVSGTYYRTKAVKRDELYVDKYQNRQGKPLDAIWGLVSDGLFQDDEDIRNSPQHSFGEVKPGDIKYKDMNNDGVIDAMDEVYLGKGGWYGAPFTLGVHLTLKWKDLTFFAMGGGYFGSYGMKSGSYYWVQGDGKYSEVVRNRWTEATKDVATYPRLTSLRSDNNFRNSDFWLYKRNSFSLHKVQVTYDLPKRILKKSFIDGLSVYATGFNLLTISKERKHMDTVVGGEPYSRAYNLGVKVVF